MKTLKRRSAHLQPLLGVATVALVLKTIITVTLAVNNCSGLRPGAARVSHAAFELSLMAGIDPLQPRELAMTVAMVVVVAAFAVYTLCHWRTVRRMRFRYRELQRLYRQRQLLLAKVSHEIRTPLNSIVGFAQLFNKPDVHISPDDMTEINRQMQENTDVLAGIADKMTVLSQYDTMTEVELNNAVDVTGFIGELAKVYRTKVRKGVRVDVFSYLPGQYLLLTNQTVLTLVLRNLLDNAVRFTRRGRVTIIADLPSADSEWLLLSVSDTGPGIPPERRETVFELPDDSQDWSSAPAGTGLAICRTMMRLLGGTIEIDNNYTSGTSMLLKLPTSVVVQET